MATRLIQREATVLKLFDLGFSHQEISKKLGIHRVRVSEHLQEAMAKAGVQTSYRLAYERGMAAAKLQGRRYA